MPENRGPWWAELTPESRDADTEISGPRKQAPRSPEAPRSSSRYFSDTPGVRSTTSASGSTPPPGGFFAREEPVVSPREPSRLFDTTSSPPPRPRETPRSVPPTRPHEDPYPSPRYSPDGPRSPRPTQARETMGSDRRVQSHETLRPRPPTGSDGTPRPSQTPHPGPSQRPSPPPRVSSRSVFQETSPPPSAIPPADDDPWGRLLDDDWSATTSRSESSAARWSYDKSDHYPTTGWFDSTVQETRRPASHETVISHEPTRSGQGSQSVDLGSTPPDVTQVKAWVPPAASTPLPPATAEPSTVRPMVPGHRPVGDHPGESHTPVAPVSQPPVSQSPVSQPVVSPRPASAPPTKQVEPTLPAPGSVQPPTTPPPSSKPRTPEQQSTWAIVSDSTIVGTAIPVLGTSAWEEMAARATQSAGMGSTAGQGTVSTQRADNRGPIDRETTSPHDFSSPTKDSKDLNSLRGPLSSEDSTSLEKDIDASGETDEDSETGRRRKMPKFAKIALASFLSLLLVVGGGLAYMYFDLNSQANFHERGRMGWDAQGGGREDRSRSGVDPYAGRAVNILVLGSDEREDGNSRIQGARSDTSLVVHVSADRSRIDIVSIPRDTWITIPDCEGEDGDIIAAAGWPRSGFNAAFAYGVAYGGSINAGASCAAQAVRELGGIEIDAYIVIKFSGFRNVVNTIGGIDVELLCPIYAPKADGLDLPAGVSHLNGKEALGLARARTGQGLGDGSDLHRIHRQHAVFGAVLNKIYDMNYVKDFTKLYGLARDVLGSIDTNLGENLTQLAGFAYSLRDLNTDNVTMIMLPVNSAGNGTNVVMDEYAAEPIWEAIRKDKPLPEAELEPSGQPSGQQTANTETGPDYSQPPPSTAKGKPVVVQRESDC